MKRWTVKRLRGLAHEIGWGFTTSEPGHPKVFKYFVKKSNGVIIPCVDLEIAAIPILNERNRRGFEDVWKNPMKD